MTKYPIIENGEPTREIHFKNGSVLQVLLSDEIWRGRGNEIEYECIVFNPTFIIPEKWRWRQVDKAKRMMKKYEQGTID